MASLPCRIEGANISYYAYGMNQEWDWPPTRGRSVALTTLKRNLRSPDRGSRYRTIDVYQPTGWNSPGVKMAIHIYWLTTITIIKMLLAIPLTIMAIGAFWLIWTIINL